MKKIFFALLGWTFLAGCASVMHIEPTPDSYTLAEAETIVEKVMTRDPFCEKYKINDTQLSFIDTRKSGTPIQVPLEGLVNMVTRRGFSDGQYYSALVTVYFKDKKANVKRFDAECTSLKEARDFVSAMTKISQSAKVGKTHRLAELERAYKKGILTRKEYLDKKEKFGQKF